MLVSKHTKEGNSKPEVFIYSIQWIAVHTIKTAFIPYLILSAFFKENVDICTIFPLI